LVKLNVREDREAFIARCLDKMKSKLSKYIGEGKRYNNIEEFWANSKKWLNRMIRKWRDTHFQWQDHMYGVNGGHYGNHYEREAPWNTLVKELTSVC